MTEPVVLEALAAAARALDRRGERFALVGGLAVSIHGEVRFTRDVDLAVAVADDQAAERLVYAMRAEGYEPFASVEHDERDRGFDRGEDLDAKLAALLEEMAAD